MVKMFSLSLSRRKRVSICPWESDPMGLKGSRGGEAYMHMSCESLAVTRMPQAPLTSAGMRSHPPSSKLHTHGSVHQQAARAQSLLSGWQFSQGCCVFVTNDHYFTLNGSPITTQAAYWTYTPFPTFRAVKTCSRPRNSSHNPMDFSGWVRFGPKF